MLFPGVLSGFNKTDKDKSIMDHILWHQINEPNIPICLFTRDKLLSLWAKSFHIKTSDGIVLMKSLKNKELWDFYFGTEGRVKNVKSYDYSNLLFTYYGDTSFN
jgi:hypothetical protein